MGMTERTISLPSAPHCAPEKRANFETVQLEIVTTNFNDIWLKCSKDSRIEFVCFSFCAGLLFYPYNFEVHSFKVGTFFETQCIYKYTSLHT